MMISSMDVKSGLCGFGGLLKGSSRLRQVSKESPYSVFKIRFCHFLVLRHLALPGTRLVCWGW